MNEKPFRPNVGGVLRNADGLLLMAERLFQPGAWQFPQGGVKPNEALEAALWRELGEELGLGSPTTSCRIVAVAPAMRYRFPPQMKARVTERYVGQEQTLFLLDFLGQDSDFALDAHPKPEFRAVRWVTPLDAVEMTWSRKRPIVVGALRAWAEHFDNLDGDALR